MRPNKNAFKIPLDVHNNIQLCNHLYHFKQAADTMPSGQLTHRQQQKLDKILKLTEELSDELFVTYDTVQS